MLPQRLDEEVMLKKVVIFYQTSFPSGLMDGANNKRSLTLEISLDAVKISFFPWWFIRWGSATKKNSAWCLDALLTPYVFFLFESYCSREEYYQNDYHLADWTLSLSFVVKTEQASYEHEFVKDAKRDKANNRSIIQSAVQKLSTPVSKEVFDFPYVFSVLTYPK